MKQFFFLIFSLSSLFPIFATAAPDPLLAKSKKSGEYKKLTEKLLRRHLRSTERKRILSAQHDVLLEKAIAKGSTYTGERLGLTEAQLQGLAIFFESQKQSLQQNGSNVFIKKNSTYPRDLVFSKASRHWYILGDDTVAKGHKKRLVKALMYNSQGFSLIGCAVQENMLSVEKKSLKKLHNEVGVMRVFDLLDFGSTSYVFCKFYREGSLESFFARNDHQMTLRQKEEIALQLISGLEAIQNKNIVHRDLKSANLLLDSESGTNGQRVFTAAICDFGRAIPLAKVDGQKAQWNPSFNAPEAIHFEVLSAKDYYKTDVFALGCNLYQLFYGDAIGWENRSLVKNSFVAPNVRTYLYAKRLSHCLKNRYATLQSKSGNSIMTEKERFEFLVLQMLHPDPSKRPTVKELCMKLEKIMRKRNGTSKHQYSK